MTTGDTQIRRWISMPIRMSVALVGSVVWFVAYFFYAVVTLAFTNRKLSPFISGSDDNFLMMWNWAWRLDANARKH
jgi:hypothetical protein